MGACSALECRSNSVSSKHRYELVGSRSRRFDRKDVILSIGTCHGYRSGPISHSIRHYDQLISRL